MAGDSSCVSIPLLILTLQRRGPILPILYTLSRRTRTFLTYSSSLRSSPFPRSTLEVPLSRMLCTTKLVLFLTHPLLPSPRPTRESGAASSLLLSWEERFGPSASRLALSLAATPSNASTSRSTSREFHRQKNMSVEQES